MKSNKDVQVAVDEYFESLEKWFFKTGIMAWEIRSKKCIQLGGDYLEHEKHFRKSLYLFSWSGRELFNPPLCRDEHTRILLVFEYHQIK